eukprot:UN25075
MIDPQYISLIYQHSSFLFAFTVSEKFFAHVVF